MRSATFKAAGLLTAVAAALAILMGAPAAEARMLVHPGAPEPNKWWTPPTAGYQMFISYDACKTQTLGTRYADIYCSSKIVRPTAITVTGKTKEGRTYAGAPSINSFSYSVSVSGLSGKATVWGPKMPLTSCPTGWTVTIRYAEFTSSLSTKEVRSFTEKLDGSVITTITSC